MSDEVSALSPADQAKLERVVAEYAWVAGLIRYYREVELKTLGATGVLLSGVVAGFTALRAAEKDTVEEQALQALLLSVAAWVPAVSLLIVLMATVRGYRAAVYVRDRLRPLAVGLAGDDDEVLAWERDAQGLAFGKPQNPRRHRTVGGDPQLNQHGGRGETAVSDRSMVPSVLPWLATGTPVMLLVTIASLLLAVVGATLRPSLVTAAIGGAAAALAVGLATYGVRFTGLWMSPRGANKALPSV